MPLQQGARGGAVEWPDWPVPTACQATTSTQTLGPNSESAVDSLRPPAPEGWPSSGSRPVQGPKPALAARWVAAWLVALLRTSSQGEGSLRRGAGHWFGARW